jgi:large subunit ribosomal protein L29
MAKAASFREVTADELDQQLEDMQKELFNLRHQQASGQIEQPLRLRTLRRDVARIRTVLTEKAKAGQAE